MHVQWLAAYIKGISPLWYPTSIIAAMDACSCAMIPHQVAPISPASLAALVDDQRNH